MSMIKKNVHANAHLQYTQVDMTVKSSVQNDFFSLYRSLSKIDGSSATTG